MLCKLSIQDIAVIERAAIMPDAGFTVLTGETGAGKSLIIDAINMVLGGRTGRDIIRTGAACAVCEAAFYGAHPLADETGMLVLRRELYADGRNLCSINGRMVTVTGLREAGETLLRIHGQHDTEKLMHRASHLAYVDTFAGTAKLREAYQTQYRQQQTLLREIAALEQDDGEKLKRLDMLQFWLEEIENAAPLVGEDEDLETARGRLRHAESIRTAAARAYDAVCGAEGGARDLLSEAARTLESVASYDERLGKAAETLRDAQYQAEDAAQTLLFALEEETDSGRLEEIEARLDLLYKLKSKYGGSIPAVLAYAADAARERDEIQTSDRRLAEKRQALAETQEALGRAAAALTEARRAAAKTIASRTEKELAALDMQKTRFSVSVEPIPYGEQGADAVEFFIATGPKEELKPMQKIASGGELSRICLALQTVLAVAKEKTDNPPTLIFDEIDTGISGRAAQKVGEKLHALAQSFQILCVTHLPQIAARAHAQIKVDKAEKDGAFAVTALPLDRAGRAQEIARMISGDAVTDMTLKTAEEMLD